ncbi:phage portal protein [Lysinibacillus sp. NPDC086135]|uniref:phage portal protein n=1 Tax=Lysinibacillus sp. NPDC086135 TaxID=3364130 RepID=UPI0037F1C43D
MNLFSFGKSNQSNTTKKSQKVKMLTSDENDSYFNWDGNIYENDIIRSVIRAKAKAVAKTTAEHVRKSGDNTTINPDFYMKMLLKRPNPIMGMQQLLEKTVTQLELNNNAYIFINRDDNGYPIGLYPIIATNVQVLASSNDTFLRFTIKKNGQIATFNYKDVIHLRQDFNDSDMFGSSNVEALASLMQVVNSVDKGIIKAIKNSNVVQWLLKYQANLTEDDVKKQTKRFTDSFLNIDSEYGGAAGIDNKVDAERVEPKSYMPDKEFQKENAKRIYNYFGINEKIVSASFDENEWNAFYESSIEPILIQLSEEFTYKLFTRKEISYGNEIRFISKNLMFASMTSKIALGALADRAILNPNEIRDILGYAPHDNGDEFLLRKDTGKTTDRTG